MIAKDNLLEELDLSLRLAKYALEYAREQCKDQTVGAIYIQAVPRLRAEVASTAEAIMRVNLLE